jgi:hypothetical protein
MWSGDTSGDPKPHGACYTYGRSTYKILNIGSDYVNGALKIANLNGQFLSMHVEKYKTDDIMCIKCKF